MAASKFMQTPVTRSPRPLPCAFSFADSDAFGLMSVATTSDAPARAAASARMPEPVPTSHTRLPVRSSVSMNSANFSLLMKNFGWNTVGRTRSLKPAACEMRMSWRFRMKWYEKKWIKPRSARRTRLCGPPRRPRRPVLSFAGVILARSLAGVI